MVDARRRSVVRELVTDDGVNLCVTLFPGSGPAVVILHGLAGSGREFLATADALAGRTVVLVDQRGHGSSTRLPADTSRRAFVDDVVRVIETEGLGAVDLVGQSLGAHTAMLAAAARPDLVRRLVLLECDAGGTSAEEVSALGEYFRSWETPFPTRASARTALGDGPLARAWVADLEEHDAGFSPRFDPEVMVRTITAAMPPSWEEWGAVRTPTLILYADQGMFTDEQKTQFAERGANALRVDIPRASHDAHLDAFDPWIRLLKGFIDGP